MSYRTDIPFFDNHQICTNLMQIIDGGQTQRGAETNCDADGEDCCLYNQEPTGVCGDGVVQPGEACDDGNTSDGDGCSAACEVECGFACEKKSEGLRIFSTCTRHCGDGVVQWELGEECDDTSKCCDGCRLAPSHNAECSAHAATPTARFRPTAGRAPRRTAPPPACASAPSALRGSRSSTRSPASSSTRWRAR